MRIRISTSPPLPSLKAWFPINEKETPEERTVISLKKLLCANVEALRNARVQSYEIALLLDDFDLLDETTLDVLRDGDLVCIERRVTAVKRKAEGEHSPRKRAKVTNSAPLAKAHPQVESSSDSSSDDSSDTSSDSSDDTSDDDSSDDDCSDDSSSSSSSSPPTVLPSKHRLNKPRSAVTKSITTLAVHAIPKANALPVPPGYGKPSTHSRNLRRRKKIQYERSTESSLPLPAASANVTPLGIPSIPLSTTMIDDSAVAAPTSTPDYDMMTLSNKNKRRGFKRSMAGVIPQRITFDEPSQAPVLPSGAASTSVSRPTSPTKFPRLIPPSEKQELGQLPPNMFVTSVDVEEGLWPRKRKNNKGRNAGPARGDGIVWEEEGWDRKQKKRQRDTYGQEGDDTWDRGLPYDDEAAAAMAADVDGPNWERIEKDFDKLPLVLPESPLSPENLLAWKELGIHPVTLTPEMILNLARVTRVDSDSGRLWVRMLVRPVAFGGAEEDVDIAEETEHARVSVDTSRWRLVSSQYG
ncbi:hypothetical protein OF83DRAFT_1142260 [Amylostereum chailletii]|nr:hypothetical protein OF83DRAFT_1142260 [Amylostereum chailletii]